MRCFITLRNRPYVARRQIKSKNTHFLTASFAFAVLGTTLMSVNPYAQNAWILLNTAKYF